MFFVYLFIFLFLDILMSVYDVEYFSKSRLWVGSSEKVRIVINLIISFIPFKYLCFFTFFYKRTMQVEPFQKIMMNGLYHECSMFLITISWLFYVSNSLIGKIFYFLCVILVGLYSVVIQRKLDDVFEFTIVRFAVTNSLIALALVVVVFPNF